MFVCYLSPGFHVRDLDIGLLNPVFFCVPDGGSAFDIFKRMVTGGC